MDDSTRQKIILEAQELFDKGRTLEAGKLIYEHIPKENIAQWAANILSLALEHFPSSADTQAVLEFAKYHNAFSEDIYTKCRNAHTIVDKVNRFPYILPDPYDLLIFRLATYIGKAVYNAQNCPAPFDYHAGWEIAGTLMQIAQGIGSYEFTTKAWEILCTPEHMILEIPIIDPVLYLLYPQWYIKQQKEGES